MRIKLLFLLFIFNSLHVFSQINSELTHSQFEIPNNLQKEQADSLKGLGDDYFNQQKYVKSIESYTEAQQIYKNLGEDETYWFIFRDIGYAYHMMGDYVKSFETYLKALKYFEDTKNWEKIAYLYNNMGILFHRQGESERALSYYNQADSILKKHPEIEGSIHCMLQTNMGLSYYELGEYEKAITCYQKSIKYNEQNEQLKSPYIYTVNIGNLASVYRRLKDYEQSEAYFKEAIAKSKEMMNEASVAANQGDLGTLYLTMAEEKSSVQQRNKLLNQAIDSYQKALQTFKKNNDFGRYQGYSKELSQAYELKGDYKKSLELYKEHITYKDSLYSEETGKEMARREIQYEFEKKEEAIRADTEKEIAVRDAILEANKKQKWLFIAGIFLLVVVGILLYYQNHTRKKTNEKLTLLNQELNEANQVKVRFFSILNHDLRSPVSNIIKLIRLQQNPSISLDNATKQRLQTQTVESAENLLEAMEDLLLWSKGQMENFKPYFQQTRLDDVFDDVQTFFSDISDIKITFQNQENLSLYSDENYLKTIMRNLTNNAVKALEKTENPEIIWKAYTENNQKILSITDNGKGGTEEEFKALYDKTHTTGIKSGLGLHLVRDMAKAIGGKIEVISEIDKGTTIKIIFT